MGVGEKGKVRHSRASKKKDYPLSYPSNFSTYHPSLPRNISLTLSLPPSPSPPLPQKTRKEHIATTRIPFYFFGCELTKRRLFFFWRSPPPPLSPRFLVLHNMMMSGENDFRRNAAVCLTRLVEESFCSEVTAEAMWAPPPSKSEASASRAVLTASIAPVDWCVEESFVEFTHRVYTRSHVEDQVAAAHIALMSEFIARNPHNINATEAKALSVVCLQVAAKVVTDRVFGNNAIARLAGMRLREFNHLERWFLLAMEWDVEPNAAKTNDILESLRQRTRSPKTKSLRGLAPRFSTLSNSTVSASSNGSAKGKPTMPHMESRYQGNRLFTLRLVEELPALPTEPSSPTTEATSGGSAVRMVRFLRRIFA